MTHLHFLPKTGSQNILNTDAAILQIWSQSLQSSDRRMEPRYRSPANTHTRPIVSQFLLSIMTVHLIKTKHWKNKHLKKRCDKKYPTWKKLYLRMCTKEAGFMTTMPATRWRSRHLSSMFIYNSMVYHQFGSRLAVAISNSLCWIWL